MPLESCRGRAGLPCPSSSLLPRGPRHQAFAHRSSPALLAASLTHAQLESFPRKTALSSLFRPTAPSRKGQRVWHGQLGNEQ